MGCIGQHTLVFLFFLGQASRRVSQRGEGGILCILRDYIYRRNLFFIFFFTRKYWRELCLLFTCDVSRVSTMLFLLAAHVFTSSVVVFLISFPNKDTHLMSHPLHYADLLFIYPPE